MPSERMERGVRRDLIQGGLALCQAWYRGVPVHVGKRALWYHVVQPILSRHDLALEARTGFGARMRLRPPDTIQTYIYFFGVWEPSISAYLSQALGPGDIMIDVGANVGYDTLLAARRVGPGGVVYAIEASPSVYGLLRENLALNRTVNVVPLHAAVTARAGSAAVFLHDRANLGGTTIMPRIAAERGAMLEAQVPALPLPALVPEAAIIGARVIKVDVEGAEWPVIQGILPLLPRLSPATELLVEVNAAALGDHGMDTATFLDVFRRAGFTAFRIPNSYSVNAYIDATPHRPEPLDDRGFDQADLLFRRVG